MSQPDQSVGGRRPVTQAADTHPDNQAPPASPPVSLIAMRRRKGAAPPVRGASWSFESTMS